jgi:hypothetical protein
VIDTSIPVAYPKLGKLFAFEGQGDSRTLTRIEAFMHQAQEYRQTKKA